LQYLRGGVIELINGSFRDIKNLEIDWFIAVNFTHAISDKEMASNLQCLTKNNRIHHFILDEVTGNYEYTHDYKMLMPQGYILADKLGPYASDGGRRYIKVFQNLEVI